MFSLFFIPLFNICPLLPDIIGRTLAENGGLDFVLTFPKEPFDIFTCPDDKPKRLFDLLHLTDSFNAQELFTKSFPNGLFGKADDDFYCPGSKLYEDQCHDTEFEPLLSTVNHLPSHLDEGLQNVLQLMIDDIADKLTCNYTCAFFVPLVNILCWNFTNAAAYWCIATILFAAGFGIFSIFAIKRRRQLTATPKENESETSEDSNGEKKEKFLQTSSESQSFEVQPPSDQSYVSTNIRYDADVPQNVDYMSVHSASSSQSLINST